jgi:GNAT superfamily N-acetyltransferase
MMCLDLCHTQRTEQARRMKAPGNYLLRGVGPLDVDRLVEMDNQVTGCAWRQRYERKTRHVEGEIHVSIGAEFDGRLVGAMLGTLLSGEFGVPEPVAVLDTILVDRACLGAGVATAMVERLAENLRNLGVRRLRTELSWAERQWNGFLSGRGFRPMRWVSLPPPVEASSRGSENNLYIVSRPQPRALQGH